MKSFISSTEAAKRLAVSVATLSRWRTDKKGPAAYKIGKSFKYDEQELADYIQSCREADEAGKAELQQIGATTTSGEFVERYHDPPLLEARMHCRAFFRILLEVVGGTICYTSGIATLHAFLESKQQKAEETDQALIQCLFGSRTNKISVVPARHHPFKRLQGDDVYPIEAECCIAYRNRFADAYVERRVNGWPNIKPDDDVVLFGSQISNLLARDILGNPFSDEVIERIEYCNKTGSIVSTIPLRWNLRMDKNSATRVRRQYGRDWEYHDYALYDFRTKADIRVDDPNTEDLLLITVLPRYTNGGERAIFFFGLHGVGTLASSKLILQPPLDELRRLDREISQKLAHQAYQALFSVCVDKHPQTGELQPISLKLEDAEKLHWRL